MIHVHLQCLAEAPFEGLRLCDRPQAQARGEAEAAAAGVSVYGIRHSCVLGACAPEELAALTSQVLLGLGLTLLRLCDTSLHLYAPSCTALGSTVRTCCGGWQWSISQARGFLPTSSPAVFIGVNQNMAGSERAGARHLQVLQLQGGSPEELEASLGSGGGIAAWLTGARVGDDGELASIAGTQTTVRLKLLQLCRSRSNSHNTVCRIKHP